MTSLLTSPILLQPVQKCKPYDNQLSDIKHGKTKYYELQIEWYINQHGMHKTANEAYSYFDIPDLRAIWTKRYFTDKYSNLRSRMRRNNGDAQVTLTPSATTQRTSPSNDHYASAINEMKKVIDRLTSRKDHTSQQTKQTLLSSVMRLDSQGKLLNASFLQFLCPSLVKYTQLKQKCMSLKHTFNTTNTSLLHDPNAANKGGPQRDFPEYVDEHILAFWNENCTDDPNTKKHTVMNKRSKDRYEHHNLLCHLKFYALHNQWLESVKPLNWPLKKLPCLTYFMKVKPPYVYKVEAGDYSQCKKCFNFESLKKALLRRLSRKGAHKLASVDCPNHDWYAMDSDECSCDSCFDATATLKALSKSPLRLIQHLCCVNASRYPDIDCVDGKCKNERCGTVKIEELLHSDLINVPHDDIISFKKIIRIDRIPQKKKNKVYCSATVVEKLQWSEFVAYFINELIEYKKHHNEWIHQHQTRRDYVDKKCGRIGDDCAYMHFDFINNIKVLFDDMHNGQWGDREGVSFLVSYDRFRDENGKIIEESASYFCDDTKHDWSAATTFIRKHFIKRIKDFKERYGRRLEKVFCWSDNGEFKCSGFLCVLNITIFWNFTAGGHSKGKHDGEGHVVKCEYRSAIISGALRLNILNEPYSLSIKKYMEKYFGQKEKRFSFKRTFHHIPKEEIKHFKSKSVCDTLDGINKHHCFLITRSRDIYYRRLTCCCHWCMSLAWRKCDAVSVCGSWGKHVWKLSSSSSVSLAADSNNSSAVCAVPSVVRAAAGQYQGATTHSYSAVFNRPIPALNNENSAAVNQHNQRAIQQQQSAMYNASHAPSEYLYNNRMRTRFPY